MTDSGSDAMVREPRAGQPLRFQLAIIVAVAVILPLSAIAFIGARQIARREDRGARRSMGLLAAAVVRAVNPLIGEHLRAVSSIAQGVNAPGTPDPAALGTALMRARQVYPGFLTMIATDSAGVVRAAAPVTDALGNPVVDGRRSVADRPYFQATMGSGAPNVSDVFLGRGFGRDPIVALSAPLVSTSGRLLGIVEGSLDLTTLRGLEGPPQFIPTDVVLLDRNDRVIFASRGTGYQVLESLRESPLVTARQTASDNTYQFNDRGEAFIATAVPAEVPGWYVVVRQRREDVRRTTTDFLRAMLLAFTLGLVLSVLLAWQMADRVTRPLQALEHAVRGFLTTGTSALPPPARVAPREVATLVDGFREMERRLGRTLSGLLPVCAWCHRIRDEQDDWLNMEAYVSQRSDASFSHGICPDCAARLEE